MAAASNFLSPHLQSFSHLLHWLSLWEEVPLPQTPAPPHGHWSLPSAFLGTNPAVISSPVSSVSASYWSLLISVPPSASMSILRWKETGEDGGGGKEREIRQPSFGPQPSQPGFSKEPSPSCECTIILQLTPAWHPPRCPLTLLVPALSPQ